MANYELTRGEYGNEIHPQPGSYFGEDDENEKIAEPGPSFDGWYPTSEENATGVVVFDQDFGWMHY